MVDILNEGCKELTVPDDEVELLRSVLARAHEKRQPLPVRIVKALKNSISLRSRRRPVIKSLSIIQTNKDAA